MDFRLVAFRCVAVCLRRGADKISEEILKAQEDLNGILSTRQSEIIRLDAEITEKRAELERLIKSRSEWLASVGIR